MPTISRVGRDAAMSSLQSSVRACMPAGSDNARLTADATSRTSTNVPYCQYGLRSREGSSCMRDQLRSYRPSSHVRTGRKQTLVRPERAVNDSKSSSVNRFAWP